jgi:hypothetical protein
MVMEIIFDNKIKIFFYFKEEINIFVYIIEMILSLSFSIVIWTKFEFNIKDKK